MDNPYVYRYEMHCHTSQTSRCSRFGGAEMARFYKKLGYSGICISDHFFNGNTTVPRSGEWRERVELFNAGYQSAYDEGKRIGLDVFFAWEYSLGGSDFLTYGLDTDWLFNTPEVMEWTINEYLKNVRELGAFVTQAHPFRQAGYISMIRLLPDLIDAVEVDNSSMPPQFNSRAEWYANEYKEQYGLLKVAGSDTHWDKRERLAGCEFDHRMTDIREMISALKAGDDGRSEKDGYQRFSLTPIYSDI